MVTITCGVNSLPTAKVIGSSVGEVRRSYREQLNIPAGARAIVNGRPGNDDTTLKSGDELEFVKETGEKGC